MRTYIFLLLLIICSCEKGQIKDIKTVVERDLVTFSSDQIPSQLQRVINTHRIIILGETHYVQEHQEYISTILENTSDDSTIFITESFNAFNWMIEDYVNSKIDYLPNSVNYFDSYWINRIRNINNSERHVQIYFMDVNHWQDNFINSISEIEKIIGLIEEFQNIKQIKIDSKEYTDELLLLKAKFEKEQDILIQKYGSWYKRFFQLIDLEKESSDYRLSKNEDKREEFMTRLIIDLASKNPSKKIIINCGMYHAQKETLMGTGINRIGYFIKQEYPSQTYIIAFLGVKGVCKFHFYDESVVSFNLLNETKRHDLVNIIGNEAKNNYSFLIMDDEIFTEKMEVTYTTGSKKILSPAKQFDAIITYPEISILISMGNYDYN